MRSPLTYWKMYELSHHAVLSLKQLQHLGGHQALLLESSAGGRAALAACW